jgi:predicted lysophospholipase L1 biosynthesis ABC-type transport system permease subunit
LNNIKTQALIGRFALILCAVIGVLLLLACTSILKTSLQVSTNDNLTFVSILKAQGFDNRKAAAIFWAELFVIYTSALIGSIVLYTASLFILPNFINLNLFGLPVDVLSFNFFVAGLVAAFALTIALIISIKPFRTIKRSDIVSIMHNND